MQELELKMEGGLMREGGRNRGILRYLPIFMAVCDGDAPGPPVAAP